MTDKCHRSRLREAIGAIPKNSSIWRGLVLVLLFIPVSGRDASQPQMMN